MALTQSPGAHSYINRSCVSNKIYVEFWRIKSKEYAVMLKTTLHNFGAGLSNFCYMKTYFHWHIFVEKNKFSPIICCMVDVDRCVVVGEVAGGGAGVRGERARDRDATTTRSVLPSSTPVPSQRLHGNLTRIYIPIECNLDSIQFLKCNTHIVLILNCR